MRFKTLKVIVLVFIIILTNCISQPPTEEKIAEENQFSEKITKYFQDIDDDKYFNNKTEKNFVETVKRFESNQINPEIFLNSYLTGERVNDEELKDLNEFLDFYEKYPNKTKFLMEKITGKELVEKVNNPVFVKAYTRGIDLDACMNLSNIKPNNYTDKYIEELVKFDPDVQKRMTNELVGSVKEEDVKWIKGITPKYANAVYKDGFSDTYERQHALLFYTYPDIRAVVLSLPQSLDGITPEEINADKWLLKVISADNSRLSEIRIEDMNDPTGQGDKIYSYPLNLEQMVEYFLMDGIGVIITRNPETNTDVKYLDFTNRLNFCYKENDETICEIKPDGKIDQTVATRMYRKFGKKGLSEIPDFRWDKKNKKWVNKTRKVEGTRFEFFDEKKELPKNIVFLPHGPAEVTDIYIVTPP